MALEHTAPAGRWRCPDCGRTNSPRDRYCGGCGFDDESRVDDEEEAEAQAEAGKWTPIPGLGLHVNTRPEPPSDWDRPILDVLRDRGAWPKRAPSTNESGAHRLLNGLLQLWAVGLALVILAPLVAGSGAGAGGTAVGAVAGFGLAAVLFVPWLIGLVILLVLRSTTRGR